jgi:hypothetical protein
VVLFLPAAKSENMESDSVFLHAGFVYFMILFFSMTNGIG